MVWVIIVVCLFVCLRKPEECNDFSQSLAHRHGAICAMDFSEPYGLLVSSSNLVDDGGGARVWDLATGDELGRLLSDDAQEIVKCVQVEDNTCLTGGSDSRIRIWNLGGAVNSTTEDGANNSASTFTPSRPIGDSEANPLPRYQPSTELCGHSGAVSALYFDESCLVGGNSASTVICGTEVLIGQRSVR
jgi:division protein 1